MKKFLIVILVICFIGIGFAVYISKTVYQNKDVIENNNIESKSENKDEVSIENGNIKNENLIDEFIQNVSDTKQKIELNIKLDNDNVKVTFTPGENALNKEESEEQIVDIGDNSIESNKKYNGYYSLYKNNELLNELPLYTWNISRTTKNDMVTLRFEKITDKVSEDELPVICLYNISSSNYEKNFKLSYNQRKDMGIREIYDNGEYKLKTFGGEASVTIEDDMVYKLEDAIEQGVITCEDILNQAKMDEKYGICDENYYQDGGSTEYLYDEYTILKLNTLDGDKDLVIGMTGEIINAYEKLNK